MKNTFEGGSNLFLDSRCAILSRRNDAGTLAASRMANPTTFIPLYKTQLLMAANRLSFLYPLLVWFATIVVSPFVSIAAETLYNGTPLRDAYTDAWFLFLIVAYGAVVFFPALIIMCLAFIKIKAAGIRTREQKAWLICVGVCLVFATFYVVAYNYVPPMQQETWLWPVSYSVVLVVAGLLIKIKAPVTDE